MRPHSSLALVFKPLWGQPPSNRKQGSSRMGHEQGSVAVEIRGGGGSQLFWPTFWVPLSPEGLLTLSAIRAQRKGSPQLHQQFNSAQGLAHVLCQVDGAAHAFFRRSVLWSPDRTTKVPRVPYYRGWCARGWLLAPCACSAVCPVLSECPVLSKRGLGARPGNARTGEWTGYLVSNCLGPQEFVSFWQMYPPCR